MVIASFAGCTTRPDQPERTQFAHRISGAFIVPGEFGQDTHLLYDLPPLKGGSEVIFRAEPGGELAVEYSSGRDVFTGTAIFNWTSDGDLQRTYTPEARGVAIPLGPAKQRVHESIETTPSGVRVRSTFTESGLLLFVIPWQDPPKVLDTCLQRREATANPGDALR